MLEQPKRIYIYNKRVFLTYRKKYERWTNERMGGKPWHCWNEWFVGFGVDFSASWFGFEDFYYDAHTYKSFSFCKLVVFKGFSWQSEEFVSQEV